VVLVVGFLVVGVICSAQVMAVGFLQGEPCWGGWLSIVAIRRGVLFLRGALSVVACDGPRPINTHGSPLRPVALVSGFRRIAQSVCRCRLPFAASLGVCPPWRRAWPLGFPSRRVLCENDRRKSPPSPVTSPAAHTRRTYERPPHSL